MREIQTVQYSYRYSRSFLCTSTVLWFPLYEYSYSYTVMQLSHYRTVLLGLLDRYRGIRILKPYGSSSLTLVV